ncbi:hypothetical protein M752DRAFT_292643 [Aspergillus phoenicis ATCC 13157]|uniref:Uncharacterized protein n=1 Tax=Aspergillus phoenicis ATCC 13157 TaxID=1353007 RepID=A0A370PMQ1_ASPPH|nr:hypothetical protein M752DRAFT_292643 [Aspergillus phoenicis ATCC 13157]
MDTLLYPTLLRDLWPHLDMSHWPTLDRHLYPFYPISLPLSIPVTQHPDPILARRLRLKESGITFEYYKKLFYTPLDNLILITIEFSLDTLLANMPDCDTLAHTPIDRHHPHCIFAILKSAKQHLRRSLRTGKFANKAINQKKYHVLFITLCINAKVKRAKRRNRGGVATSHICNVNPYAICVLSPTYQK